MPANFTFGSSPASSMTAFGGSTESDIFKQFYPKYPSKADVLSGTPAATTPSTAVNAAANAVAGIPVSPGTTPAVTTPATEEDTGPDWDAISRAISGSRIANPYGTSWQPGQISTAMNAVRGWWDAFTPEQQAIISPGLLATATETSSGGLYGTPESYFTRFKSHFPTF